MDETPGSGGPLLKLSKLIDKALESTPSSLASSGAFGSILHHETHSVRAAAGRAGELELKLGHEPVGDVDSTAKPGRTLLATRVVSQLQLTAGRDLGRATTLHRAPTKLAKSKTASSRRSSSDSANNRRRRPGVRRRDVNRDVFDLRETVRHG